MICPKCAYNMDAFDNECPRCNGKGVPKQLPSCPTSPVLTASPQSIKGVTFLPTAAGPTRYDCPKCGQGHARFTNYCARCGASLNYYNTDATQFWRRNKARIASGLVILLISAATYGGWSEYRVIRHNILGQQVAPTPTSAPAIAPTLVPPVTSLPPPTAPPRMPQAIVPRDDNSASPRDAAPQSNTITVTPYSLVDQVKARLDDATTQDQCNGVKGALAQIYLVAEQRRQSLLDMGDSGSPSVSINMLEMLLDNLAQAVEYKRKALIQGEPGAGGAYQYAVSRMI